MVTFVLWGRKENYPVWQEDVVAEVGTENELDRAKKSPWKKDILSSEYWNMPQVINLIS